MTGDTRPCIALDWNGTVVSDADRARDSAQAALDAIGLPPDVIAELDEFRRLFRLPMESFFESLGVQDAAVDRAVTVWNDEMRSRPTVLAPGAREMFVHGADAGIDIHIVSGARADAVCADADVFGLTPMIKRIHGSAHPKRAVLGKLRADYGALTYVGDTTYDILEGLAAGAHTVGVRYGYHPPDRLIVAGAARLIDSLDALRPR